jgi:hypothetical protein
LNEADTTVTLWANLCDSWKDLVEREDWIRENPLDPDIRHARDRTHDHWQGRAAVALTALLEWCGIEAFDSIAPHLPETLPSAE